LGLAVSNGAPQIPAGYGVPQSQAPSSQVSSGYGAPSNQVSSGYGAPSNQVSSGYGAPSGQISSGYGAPQGPIIGPSQQGGVGGGKPSYRPRRPAKRPNRPHRPSRPSYNGGKHIRKDKRLKINTLLKHI